MVFLLGFILSFVTWRADIKNYLGLGIRFWDYGLGKFYPANVWNFD
jgi:hypothetical protein